MGGMSGGLSSDIEPARDIAGREDIAALVTEFYRRAFADPLLAPIFVDIAHLDLAAHMPIMCDFWETVLFQTGAYHRDALRLHAALDAREPLTPRHFARWLELWTGTVDDLYQGEHAERAKLQAIRIAGSIGRRLAGEPVSDLVTISRTA